MLLTALGGLLGCHKVGVGKGLWLNALAVEQVAKLVEEQVERASVNH